jgi:starch synthase
LKILFASSEVFPLIKTGGLADVSHGLPTALQKMQQDVRIVMPAYSQVLQQKRRIKEIYAAKHPLEFRLLETKLPDSGVTVWLVDIPQYFKRIGGPYTTADGYDWPDNAERFYAFCKVINEVACNRVAQDWQPDIVHCNDWQTGLTPALLQLEQSRPASVFTIHNLAYQGLFPQTTFLQLGLPPKLWSPEALEFHDQLSFIKGGLVYADIITTVSEQYAQEICTPEFGSGLDGLLNHRKNDLHGVLNGIDENAWNPARDKHIEKNYSLKTVSDKFANKLALQNYFKLPPNAETLLIGVVGRIVEQKGYDLIADALPTIVDMQIQLVMLGSGDKTLETRLSQLATQHSEQFGLKIGYDEALAHLIEAGADVFLMPSRFEPCGLNQLYSLRYGTPPIVNNTGGLADSVIDANAENIASQTANGIKFDEPNVLALLQAIERAKSLFQQKEIWQQLMLTGMRQDFSWRRSAARYLDLYRSITKQ